MKRFISFALILCFLVTITGSYSYANAEEAGTNQPAASVPAAEVKEEINYKELSEKLALQMTKGDFAQTYDTLSLAVQLQLTEAALKQGWDTIEAGMGKFLKVYEVTEETQEPYHIVNVVLQYENNGLRIIYGYNASGKLDILQINYAPIKSKPVSNKYFTETEIKLGKDHPLDAILTLPKNVKKPPVVILVQGSGTHDMDESIGPNKPFRDIAQGLAKKGIASIRYNENAMQYPNLLPATITIKEDVLNDAELAIQYAAKSKKVNNKKIYVLGHSLGGMMAPKLAADNKEVVGIISLAGSPRKLEDIILDQNKAALDMMDNMTKEEKEKTLTEVQKQVEEVKNLKKSDTATVLGMPAPYWYSLNQINTSNILKKLKIPMLILQGDADFQVYPDKDYTEWKKLLKNRKNVTFHLYDDLNHLFMTTNGKTDVTEYYKKDTVDKKVIDDIAKWIKAR